jgi:hypothetical protein
MVKDKEIPFGSTEWCNKAFIENLRDQFAMAALQGLLFDTAYDSDIRELTTKEAYLIADAMLKAREQ